MLALLIQVIVVLVVAGVFIFLFDTFVTMAPQYKVAIRVLIGLLVFLWLVSVFFGFPFSDARIRF